MWPENAQVFVAFTLGEATKGRLRDDFLNAAFMGKAQNGRRGMTLSFSCTPLARKSVSFCEGAKWSKLNCQKEKSADLLTILVIFRRNQIVWGWFAVSWYYLDFGQPMQKKTKG